MNSLFFIGTLFAILLATCYADDSAYSIWNQDAATAAVGTTDFTQSTNTPQVTIPGFQHVMNAGNQLSTYNYKTETIYFFVTSTDYSDSNLYLKSVNANGWTVGTKTTYFTNNTIVYSMESSQSTDVDDDLFVVLGVAGSSDIFVTKFQPSNSNYTIIDHIVGYNFSSASYNIGTSVFFMIVGDQKGNFFGLTYDNQGNKQPTMLYTIANMNPSYKNYGAPFNLQYLPQIGNFFCNFNIGQTQWYQHPQMFQVLPNTRTFYLEPLISNALAIKGLYGIGAVNANILYQFSSGATDNNYYAIKMDLGRDVFITSIPFKTLPTNFWFF